MKTLYTFLLLLAAYTAAAQTPCPYYKELIQKGDAEMQKSNPDYKTAMNQYNAAMLHCPAKADEAQAKVLAVFKKIEDLKNRADSLAGVAEYQLIQTQMKQKEVEKALHKTDSALAQVQIQEAKNKKIIDASYFYADRFGMAVKKDGNETKYGFINKEGDPVIDYNYSYAQPFDENTGFAVVKKEEKLYLIDTLKNEYRMEYAPTEDTNVVALDLRSKNLDSIPTKVFEMTQLKVLLLGDNRLKQIPLGMKNLGDLEYLDLSKNEIGELENLENLTNLKVFNISGSFESEDNHVSELKRLDNLTNLQRFDISLNNISKLQGLNKLTNLQIFYIKGNKISELEGLENLKKLKYFDISYNNIKELKNLENLVSLKQFKIAGTRSGNRCSFNYFEKKNTENEIILSTRYFEDNQISKLQNMGKLQNLVEFDISGNNIEKIENLDSLKLLTHLDISDNKITDVEGLEKLTSLQYLEIHCNEISNIKNIEKNTKLKRFYFDWEKVDTLPKLTYWASITELNLSDKGLTKLPIGFEKLINLKELNLSKNQLTSIPPLIGNLKKLEKLYLWDNKLTELPKEIWDITALKELYLRQNQLKSIAPLIGNLIKLEVLSLGENKLTELPKEIWDIKALKGLYLPQNQLKSISPLIGNLKKLEELYLWGNQLTEVPKEIWELTALKELGLPQNQLTSIPIPPLIGNLKKLEKLYLWDNKLTELPKEIWELTALKELGLSPNQLTSISPLIANLENLTFLSFGGNPLSVSETIEKIKNLPIEELYITDMNLETLPNNIQALKSLKKLYINNLEEDSKIHNHFSAEEKERIKNMLPSVEIEF